ncbi:OmpA family protein [Roseibium sp. M-1]
MRVVQPALKALLFGLITGFLLQSPSLATDQVFEGGWTLQRDASSLRFQSVKNLTIVESSGFAQFEGNIDESGTANIRVFLDSVDTKIDLRNVRMRFLFFETFEFPEALISSKIEPAILADLSQKKRKIVPLDFDLTLHGVSRTYQTEVAVTYLSDALVAVSTTAPISVPAADFALGGGIKKLEEAAGVVIVPSATVSFDFVFARNSERHQDQEASGQEAAAPIQAAAASTALEPEGNLDQEACEGRFEILSRTDNIYFPSGSSRLDARSEPLLNSLVDIISRCPGLVIEVGGHTDSDGSEPSNQQLSERRAGAVKQYLVSRDILESRIRSVGYGETRPVAPNSSPEGKHRNRRIEFVVVE